MGSVLLNCVKEPPYSFLVIVVLLAFNDDLLATINELIPAVLREVFLNQELATLF